MKKTTINLLVILCLTPFLIQCIATKKEIQSANVRMYSIDNRVEDIDQEIKQLKGQTVKEVRQRQAHVDDRLDNQRTEILQLKSQLEENAHYNRLLREENKETEASVNSRIDILENSIDTKINNIIEELNKKINSLNEQLVIAENQIKQDEEEIKKINQARTREAAERAREAAERARQAAKAAEEAKTKSSLFSSDGPIVIDAEKQKKVIKAKKKTTSAKTGERDDPAGELYNKGLNLYRTQKIDQAYEAFSKYLKKYPSGKMAVNALFWMGDCLYSQDEYELAILDYQKVIVDHPQHAKAPAALLKQGMAFEKLNDADMAKIVYQRVLDDFPKSEQVATAKKRLDAIK